MNILLSYLFLYSNSRRWFGFPTVSQRQQKIVWVFPHTLATTENSLCFPLYSSDSPALMIPLSSNHGYYKTREVYKLIVSISSLFSWS
jgi:competence transcription factor ComK